MLRPPTVLPRARCVPALPLRFRRTVWAVGEDVLDLDDGHSMARQMRLVQVVDLDFGDPHDPSSPVYDGSHNSRHTQRDGYLAWYHGGKRVGRPGESGLSLSPNGRTGRR